MAFDSKGLDDYVDVAQRIVEFRAKHPEGSLQPVNPNEPFKIRDLAGTDKNGKEIHGTFIIYTAAAYRTPDDQRPGIGCAYEVFPGRTPYTAGSELQNAETAAWGRAIVAALAADTRAGVASQQEVRNRRAERDDAPQGQARPQSQAAVPAPGAGSRRLDAIPEDDQWYTTPAEPAAQEPAKPRSDEALIDQINDAIDAIDGKKAGESVWAKIVAGFNARKITPDDRRALEAMVGAKVSAVMAQQQETEAA